VYLVSTEMLDLFDNFLVVRNMLLFGFLY